MSGRREAGGRVAPGATRWKRRVVVVCQRRLANPIGRVLAYLGLLPGYTILETVGRRSGRRRPTPLGVQREGRRCWLVSQQGRHAAWVRNLEEHPRVRVRLRGRWHEGTAEVLEDDDPVARWRSFGRAGHALIVRVLGTDLLSVRVTLDRDRGWMRRQHRDVRGTSSEG